MKTRIGTIDPIVKVRTHARMKVIDVKITVVASATFDIGRLRLRKKKQQQKDEQMEG